MHRREVLELLNSARNGERVPLRAEYYQELEEEYHGPLPRPCYFCSGLVEKISGSRGKGAVHHLDHDRLNNVEGNLVIAHGSCHNRYHGAQPRKAYPNLTDAHRKAIGDSVRGTVHTAKSRANMANAARTRYNDPEQRAAAGAWIRGVPKSPEHRAKLAAAQQVKDTCPDCGNEYNKTWMKRHKCEKR